MFFASKPAAASSSSKHNRKAKPRPARAAADASSAFLSASGNDSSSGGTGSTVNATATETQHAESDGTVGRLSEPAAGARTTVARAGSATATAACEAGQPTLQPHHKQHKKADPSPLPPATAQAEAGAAAPAGAATAATPAGGPIKDTPLHAALLQAPDKALDPALLEQHTADVNACDNLMGWTPLHYAAATHNIAAVEQLIHAGASPAAVAVTSGFTPLHLAVIPRADLSTAAKRQSLKQDTARLYSMQIRLSGTGPKESDGLMPGCSKIVQLLLEAGADASAAAQPLVGIGGTEVINNGIVGAQPLHLAACVAVTTVHEGGTKEAAAAAAGGGGSTAAATAATEGTAAAVCTATAAAAAAKAGRAASEESMPGSSATLSAAAAASAAASSSGGGSRSSGVGSSTAAATASSSDAVDGSLEVGPHSMRASNAVVALVAAVGAAAVRHQTSQQQRQQQGEDVTAGGSSDYASKPSTAENTPAKEHGAIILALLKAGADPDAAVPGTNAETPLTLAAQNGAVVSVAALLLLKPGGCKSADPDKPRGNDLCRPVDLAAYYGHLHTALMLLEKGGHAVPDPRCIAPAGTTVLTTPDKSQKAASGSDLAGSAAAAAAAVLAGGATGGFVDDHAEDRAPLQLLVNVINHSFGDSASDRSQSDQLELVKRIVGEGFPLDVVDVSLGATAVGLAVRLKKAEVLKVLIAAGADINMPWTKGTAASLGSKYDSSGLTPVFDAARLGFAEAVDLLIAAGADLNSCTAPHPRMCNYNIVQIAANAGRVDIVLKLVEAGAHWRLGKGDSQQHSVPSILAAATMNGIQASHIEWRLKLIEKRARHRKGLPANSSAAQAAAAPAATAQPAPAVAARHPTEPGSSGAVFAADPGRATADVDALMAELGLHEVLNAKQQLSKKAQKALARKQLAQQQQEEEQADRAGGSVAAVAQPGQQDRGCGIAAEGDSIRSQRQHCDGGECDIAVSSGSSSSSVVGDEGDADADDLEAWFSSSKNKQQQLSWSSRDAKQKQHNQTGLKSRQHQQQHHRQKDRQTPSERIKVPGPAAVRDAPRHGHSASAAVAKPRSSVQQRLKQQSTQGLAAPYTSSLPRPLVGPTQRQRQQYGQLSSSAANSSGSISNSGGMSWKDLTSEHQDPWASAAIAAPAPPAAAVGAPTEVTPPLTPKLAVSQRSSGLLTPIGAGAAAGSSSSTAAAAAGQSWAPSDLPDAMREMLMMSLLPAAAAAAATAEITQPTAGARLPDSEGQRQLQELTDSLGPAAGPAAAAVGNNHTAAGAASDAANTHTSTTSSSSSSMSATLCEAAPAVSNSQVLRSALVVDSQLPLIPGSYHSSDPNGSSSSISVAGTLLQQPANLSAELQPPITVAVLSPLQLASVPVLGRTEAVAAAAAARLPPHLLGRRPPVACLAAASTPQTAAMQLSQLLPWQLHHSDTSMRSAATAAGTGTPALQGAATVSAVLQPAAVPEPPTSAPLPSAGRTQGTAAAAPAASHSAGAQQQQQQQQQQGGPVLQHWKGNLPPSLMFAVGRQSNGGGVQATAAAAAPRSTSSSGGSSAKAGQKGGSGLNPQPQQASACSNSLASHGSGDQTGASSHPSNATASALQMQAAAAPASRISALPSWLSLGARAGQ